MPASARAVTTTQAVAAGGTVIGPTFDFTNSPFTTLAVNMQTDQAGTNFIDGSMDGGISWDACVGANSNANLANNPARWVATHPLHRVRWVNTGAVATTYTRLAVSLY